MSRRRQPRPHRSPGLRPAAARIAALATAVPTPGRPTPPSELRASEEREPAPDELRAIKAEWPVYAAYLAVVDAECRFATSPDVLARRALRRAEVALARVLATDANQQPDLPEGANR